ncbi:HEPN domain-containing protein [Pyrococcus kukulkanii]|uniref:HEPN domain-containing protein n=1 Tax=Pyrococcus kukulkanii TaxID=1609559 RepID=UPI003565DCAC
MFEREEFERWIRQVEYTLRSARADAESGFYSWACFKAQQAAKFAVKGLLIGLGIPAYGHSTAKLLSILVSQGIEVPQEILRIARVLDRFYIPARYPDAHVEGAPYEFYDKRDAEEAINFAEAILKFVMEVAKWKTE